MKHFGQPLDTLISHEILGQPQGSWVSNKYIYIY
jgi:hypothetical protein